MKIFGSLVGLLWALSAFTQTTMQFATSWPYCEETIEFYDINQETPLGFSGADLLNLTSNINAVKINYGYKSDQTVGSFDFSQVSSIARYVRSKAVYPEPGYDIAITCVDRVELDVNIIFISQDGSFMDSWDTTLRSMQASGKYAQFSIFLAPEDFKGSFYQDAPEEWMGGVLSGRISPQELSAEIIHTNCFCDNSTCETSLVVDAAIESFIPYEN